jgi:hypothetical protein
LTNGDYIIISTWSLEIVASRAYQRLRVLRLHSLSYSDHDDGGSGKTADVSVSTPSTASRSILAVDSLVDWRRSVRDRTTPDMMQRMIFVCTRRAGRLRRREE